MVVSKELLSPCGLYCGVCGIQIAHRENNQKLKEKLAGVYGLKPEEIQCRGCLSESLFVYCRVCPIRKCAQKRRFEGCYLCNEFPCEHINQFPYPEAKNTILRAVPEWKSLGTEKWVETQEKKYICPKCQSKLFRGAKRCNQCKEPVQL